VCYMSRPSNNDPWSRLLELLLDDKKEKIFLVPKYLDTFFVRYTAMRGYVASEKVNTVRWVGSRDTGSHHDHPHRTRYRLWCMHSALCVTVFLASQTMYGRTVFPHTRRRRCWVRWVLCTSSRQFEVEMVCLFPICLYAFYTD
jgi:hypothetical protein